MYKDKIIRMLRSPAIMELWKWTAAAHRSVLFLCVLNILSAVSSLTITIATRGLIDGATAHMGSRTVFYAALMVLAVLLIRGLSLLSGLWKVKTDALLSKELRTIMMKEILHKQYAPLSGYHSAELVNRMLSDVNVVKNGVLEIVPGIAGMVVSFLGASLILIKMDWRFVAVLVAGALLGTGLMLLFRRPMKSRHRAVQEAQGRFQSILQEACGNLRLIKASGSEGRMERQVEKRLDSFRSANLRRGYFSACMNNGVNLMFQLGWLFCMLWGCLGIYQGRLTYGMLAALIQLVGQIQGPIASAAGVAAQAYGTISSAERIKELLDLPEEPELEGVSGEELYENLTEIKLENLSFTYGRETENVLENVDLTIRPGDFVAVTGISGGGKSTLFQLLLGIYRPTGGKVLFGFRNPTDPSVIREEVSGRTRPLFAYVPQGNTLFSGTLRENLTMFTDGATDEEIMEAARLACIDRLILELDEGLNTVIGERGIGLSEGQAQRVAVARALLGRAPILLLDESTSALDEETEARLLQNIASLKEKTCLIVTHRKAALGICDYRIHIEDKKVSIR